MRRPWKTAAVLCALALLCALCAGVTLAWHSLSQTARNETLASAPIRLTLEKTVVNGDGSELTQEQMEAPFTFQVTFSDGGTYSYSIDGEAAGTIPSGGTVQLRHGQRAVFEGLPAGTVYTFTEIDAQGALVSSDGSYGTLTQAGAAAAFVNYYNVERVENCVLRVTKRLSEGAAATDDAFHFTLTLNGETQAFDLHAGESQDFDVAFGDAYSVTEDDLAGARWLVSSSRATGNIMEQLTEAVFTNTPVGPVEIDPPIVEKVIEGAGNSTKRFTFALVGEAGAPMPEGSEGNVKQVSLDGSGFVELGSFTFAAPGVYTYKVYEVAETAAHWTYDSAVYTLTFTVTARDGGLAVTRTLTRDGEAADRLVFTNRYSAPSTPGGRPSSPSSSPSPEGTVTPSPSPTLPDASPAPGAEETPTPSSEPGAEVTAEPTPAQDVTETETPPPSPGGPEPGGTPETSPSSTQPSGPDVPKTGDDGALGRWYAIAAIGVTGALLCAIFLYWDIHHYVGKHTGKKNRPGGRSE